MGESKSVALLADIESLQQDLHEAEQRYTQLMDQDFSLNPLFDDTFSMAKNTEEELYWQLPIDSKREQEEFAIGVLELGLEEELTETAEDAALFSEEDADEMDFISLPPAPLTPAQGIAALAQEAHVIHQTVVDYAFIGDSISEQFDAWCDLLTHNDLQPEERKRLVKAVSDITFMGKVSPNAWFAKLDALTAVADEQSRSAEIAQELRDLNYQLGSDPRHAEQIALIQSTLKRLTETQPAIDKLDLDKLEKLNQQRSRIKRWLTSPSSEQAPNRIDHYFAKDRLAASESRTMAVLAAETEQFIQKQAVPSKRRLIATSVTAASMVNQHTQLLQALHSQIKAASSQQELVQLTTALKNQELQSQQALTDVIAMYDDFSLNVNKVGLLSAHQTAAIAQLPPTEKNKYLEKVKKTGLRDEMREFMALSTTLSMSGKAEADIMCVKAVKHFIDLGRDQGGKIIAQMQEKLAQRQQNAQKSLVEIRQFINLPHAPVNIDLISIGQTLLNGIEQASDLEQAVQRFALLPAQLEKAQKNSAAALQAKTASYLVKLNAIHSDDMSAEEKQRLSASLAQCQLDFADQALTQQQQIDAQSDALITYSGQTTVHMQERIKQVLLASQAQLHAAELELVAIQSELSTLSQPLDENISIEQQNTQRRQFVALSTRVQQLEQASKTQKQTLASCQPFVEKWQLDKMALAASQQANTTQLSALQKLAGSLTSKLITVSTMQKQAVEDAFRAVSERLSQLTTEEASVVANVTLMGQCYAITQDEAIIASSQWQQYVAVATEKLGAIQVLRDQLEQLPDLDQLADKGSIKIKGDSLNDQRQKILKNLADLSTTFSNIAKNNLQVFSSTEKINTSARYVTKVEDIPNKYQLLDDPKLLATFCRQEVDTAARMANDITGLSRQLFAAIPEKEFFDLKIDRIPHYKASVDAFNQLNRYVQNDILKYKTLDARTMAMERWVVVMQHCRNEGDYHSLVAINAAFQATPLFYLKNTQAGLSSVAQKTLADLKGLLDPSQNMQVLRKEMAERTVPIVPYIGTYRTVLNSINERRSAEVKLADMPAAIHVVKLLTTMQASSNYLPTQTSRLQGAFEALGSEKDFEKRLITKRKEYEPAGSVLVPSTLLTTVAQPIWQSLEKNKSIYLQLENKALVDMMANKALKTKPYTSRVDIEAINATIMKPVPVRELRKLLHTTGIDLSAKEICQISAANKQIRYHRMLENSVLATILQHTRLKSTCSFLRWIPTAVQIAKINTASHHAVDDREMQRLLRKIGVTLTSEQLQAVQTENQRLSKPLEKASVAPAVEVVHSIHHVDIGAIKVFMQRIEDSLHAPRLSIANLAKLSSTFLSQMASDLENDVDSLRSMVARIDINSGGELHEQAAKIETIIQQKQSLLKTIPLVSDKLVVSTEQGNLQQSLQSFGETYIVCDSDKEVGQFHQCNTSTLYYDLSAKGTLDAMLQQHLLEQSSATAKANQPIYLYGPPAVVQEMAQKIYQSANFSIREKISIQGNDEVIKYNPARSSSTFFAKVPTLPPKPSELVVYRASDLPLAPRHSAALAA